MSEKDIDRHLQLALEHLEQALHMSVSTVKENEQAKKEIGQKWEQFLGQFFANVRTKGKESKVNLLSLISFPRFRSF